MKLKYYTPIIILLFLVVMGIYFYVKQPIATNENKNQSLNENDDRICVTEPGKAYYPGDEKCCNGLKSIFGSELPDGRCWCTEKDNNCGGSPICAPCGNGKCEGEYKEDRCNCPDDCK